MTTPILSLPLPILVDIFGFIHDAYEIVQLSRVCKIFREAAHDNILWKQLIEKDFACFIQSQTELSSVNFNTHSRISYQIILQRYTDTVLRELSYFPKPHDFPILNLYFDNRGIHGIYHDYFGLIQICNLKPNPSHLPKIQAIDTLLELINLDIIEKIKIQSNQRPPHATCLHLTACLTRLPKQGFLNTVQASLSICLTTLDLDLCGIQDLHPELFTLHTLTYLNLSSNAISHIPPQIAQLTKLKELRLTNNLLKDFPKAVLSLTSIEKLYLGNVTQTYSNPCPPKYIKRLSYSRSYHDQLNLNTFASIPTEIDCLTQLKVFDLRLLPLTHLPTEIQKLTSLQLLNLSYTAITQVPPDLLKIPCLIECQQTPVWDSLLKFSFKTPSRRNVLQEREIESGGARLRVYNIPWKVKPRKWFYQVKHHFLKPE